jgi:anaerobic selenocysteine-containing dehydrogenase
VITGLAKRVGAEHPGFAMTPREIIDWTLQKSGWGTLAELEPKKWIDCQPEFNQAHYIEGFRYPDKKFRFKPDWKNVPNPRPAALGVDRGVPSLPDQWDVIEKADSRHPFRLATSPSREYLNSSFNEMPSSRSRHGRPRVKVHPDDLAKLGVTDGARVRMGNERGEIFITTQAFPGIQRGVVIVECIAPNDQFEGGEGINTLTSAFQAAPYGGACFHDNHVWIEAA